MERPHRSAELVGEVARAVRPQLGYRARQAGFALVIEADLDVVMRLTFTLDEADVVTARWLLAHQDVTVIGPNNLGHARC